MADEQDKEQGEKQPESHWLLWTLVTVFIIAAIIGMWAVDDIFSPEMLDANTVPAAVGK